MNKNKIGIIGAGKVGSTLANKYNENNSLKWILAKNADYLSKNINEEKILKSIYDIAEIPELIYLTVQDTKINNVVIELLNSNLNLENVFIAHCSGFIRNDVLNDLSEKGAIICGIHPYQTFYYPENTDLNSVAFGIECDENHFARIGEFIKIIGGIPFFLDEKSVLNKELYHLSAVAISNFLTPILQLGVFFGKQTNIDFDLFFNPILKQTIKNNLLSVDKNEFPLTGIIARKDIQGLKVHLQIISKFPEILNIYISFVNGTLLSLKSRNLIDDDTYKEFKQILDNWHAFY